MSRSAPLIDAHQHCWRIDAPGVRWPTPEQAAIYRDFGIDELRALAQPLGIGASVLVQSQPDDRDTDGLLALAGDDDFIAAVVGWVDLERDDAPARIAALAAHRKLRGLRPMLQALADDDWILRPALAPALAAMQQRGLSLDALVLPRHLPVLRRLAERYPALPIVIDHAAKPGIARGEFDGWRDQMRALAALPQVFCKLSGLLTEAAPGAGAAQLRPYVAYLLENFGPERLMWGSDWPVLNLAGDYAGWYALARELSAALSETQRTALFGGTAARFYRIDTRAGA